MKSFYDKDDYTIDDLQLLIESEVEESIYLEFKSSGSLEKTDRKRIEISKDVAAFANSDGGIIVYGIKEVNHVASEFSFIDGNEFTKEWIEQVISSYVQRRIAEIKIYPIRVDGDIKKSIYIVKIPYSYDAPHQSKDNKYYKRYNFMSVPMEEYEIRQSYGRRLVSKLVMDNWGYKINIRQKDIVVDIVISVYNEGKASEPNYKTSFYLWPFNNDLSISWPQTTTNYTYTILDEKKIKVSGVSIEPIYPDEVVTTVRFQLTVDKEKVTEALENVNVELKVLYQYGDDSITGNLNKLLDDIMRELLGSNEV